jgi:tetratricopeptide (TPR) repeat protein
MQWSAGDSEGAIVLFRRLFDRLGRMSDRILDRRPDLREMRQQVIPVLALLLRQEGRYAEAMEVLEVRIEIDPENAHLWRRDLATLRVAKGEVEAGLAELRALAEENPGDLSNWLALGVEARIEGQLADSQAALEQATEAGRDGGAEALARVCYQQFLLFKEMGKLDDAAAAWEEGVTLNPDMGDTVREVYEMFTGAGRFSEARSYIDRDDNALQAGFQRGLVAYLTGDAVQARQHWQTVADLDPGDFESGHDAWVEAVLRLGDAEPALEQLQDLLQQHRTPRLLVLSGIGWAMRGDGELPAALFQQALNLLRRQRPPKKKLDSADWRLLDSLVSGEELKPALKSYFAVVETLWG